MKKSAAVILSAVLALSTSAAMSAGASAEWVKSDKAVYSYKDDATGEKLTGWQTIEGEKYCFDKDGAALKGWKKINGKTYCFYGNEKGKILTGRVKINGKHYYFGSDGAMRTGWTEIDGKTYYFNTNGVMVTGIYNISGVSYKFDKNGVLTGSMEDGALDCTIGEALQGLEFGMTKEDLLNATPWEKVPDKGDYRSGITLVVSDKLDLTCSFDEKGKYCFSFMFLNDLPKLSETKKFFTKDGWECLESKGDSSSYRGLYISPDESIAAVLSFRTDAYGERTATVSVIAYSNIDEIWQ